ncbi:hypothetical protein ATE84_2294 [Aquimarina sp. MAR_2010_214]|uniref:hypothetical protein n=1 Tax=Aquimarina sp. MAR_2010_214 TaxID=1250026 RepID=UPI000C708903|nr:hypothetical protein [Aquimarina sp. MAR_2010_214]PKV50239.1 hypothetical protein ATE84_2294 [Aquimarina sp. MAR_2010_214]
MNHSELDKRRNEYLVFIIQSLNMKVDEFMESIVKKETCYEKIIYQWVIRLFKKGLSKDKALQIIYWIRRQLYCKMILINLSTK